MTGYIAMRRDWQDHDVFGDDEFSRRDAWAWLIAHAKWRPETVTVGKRKITLERGELSHSVRFLADKWGWSKSAVARFLSKLQKEKMVDLRPVKGGTVCGTVSGTDSGTDTGTVQNIITVCNYEKFQTPSASKRDSSRDGLRDAERDSSRDKEEEYKPRVIPLAKANGGGHEAVFWAEAKAYLGQHCKGDPGALIQKWLRENGKALTIAAINAAQLERAVDPKAYIPGYFKRHAGVERVEPRLGALG